MNHKVSAAPGYGRGYLFYLIMLLGALSAFPPLVTDMYLPTLPAMAVMFHASAAAVQAGLGACIVGLAIGQILFGPLSDKFGRRPVMLSSLAVYTLATVAAIWSPGIEVFIVCRLVQGLGGAGGVVLSRSVATDCYSGHELARTLAIIAAINGIAPVIAPVVGGFFSDSIGWQGIFWILAGVGVLLAAVALPFRESLDRERRHHGSIGSLMGNAMVLLRDRRYLPWVLAFGLANAVLFGYISSAAFLIQEEFGFSELGFSMVFACNSLGIVLGSMVSLRFRTPQRALRVATAGMALGALLELGAALAGLGFAAYEALAFVTVFCVGMMFPTATTLAMQNGKAAIGWASALLGACGFTCGGLVTPLVGLGDIRVTAFAVMSVCAAGAWIIVLRASRGDR